MFTNSEQLLKYYEFTVFTAIQNTTGFHQKVHNSKHTTTTILSRVVTSKNVNRHLMKTPSITEMIYQCIINKIK